MIEPVLRPHVAAACVLAPGAAAWAALEGLMGGDLSAREWLEVTAAWSALVNAATGARLAAVAELDRAMDGDPSASSAPGRGVPGRAAADEVAAALHLAPGAASRLVSLARQVDATLPAAADALAEGRLDPAQVRALAAVTRDLPAPVRHHVEALAVRLGPSRTVGQLTEALDAEAVRHHPGHASRRVAAGVEQRDVSLRPSPLPGCRRLVADLPLVHATAAYLALNATAVRAKDTSGGESRSLGQLRADALTGLLTGTTSTTSSDADFVPVPTPHDLAQLAEVQVVVSADALAGASDTPARVPGIGAIDPATTQALAAATRWRRLIADPTTGQLLEYGTTLLHPTPHSDAGAGVSTDADQRWRLLHAQVREHPDLDHGTTRYTPPAALRAHVLTRDATCAGPACHHPASPGQGVQLDHTTTYRAQASDGTVGTTSADNLAPVCRRIHNAKTHGGWHLTQPAPGAFTWTSPLGRTYTSTPRTLVPDPPPDTGPPPT